VDREIERKFFFQPDLWRGKPAKAATLEQGYLPSTGDWEIRLRRSGTEHRYTMKTGSGLNRGEWEIPLLVSDFEALWPQTQGRRILKLRERHTWKGRSFEVDQYGASLEGLVVCEMEFPNAGQARAFAPPPAFGPELTYDPRFKNRLLAEETSKVPKSVPTSASEGWSFGVLPFRQGNRGWELILVSTRRGDRWIVPKGQPEPGRKPETVALDEAREEAGITGRRQGHPLVLPYVRETGTTNLLLFPLLVTRLADRWLESGQRERRLVPLAEAANYGDLATQAARWVEDLVQ
jgi:CYTH domain-containing protein/8-oxo-dGTP pyrophosphatase MutT (NUDIX family)